MPTFLPNTSVFSLGISPEILNQFWQQLALDGFPSGLANCGIPSDLAVTIQLTNAQLLALQTTAVQLVAPLTVSGLPSYLVPPNGFLFVPTTLTLQNKVASTPVAFTLGNADNKLQVEYTGQTTNMLSINAAGILDQTVNKVGTNLAAATGPIVAFTAGQNLGLELKLTGTTPALTVGTGTAILTLLYNLYPLL